VAVYTVLDRVRIHRDATGEPCVAQVYRGYSGAPAAVVLHQSPTLVVGGDAFTYSKIDGCLTSAVKIASAVCEHLLLQNTSDTTATTESLT